METLFGVSSVLLWVVVLFNLLLTLALVRRFNALSQILPEMQPPDILKLGEPAPDFTAETLDGEKITLADLGSRELAMVFVSPGCTPCREYMPTLNDLYPKAKQAGVELILMSIANQDQTREYVAEFGFEGSIITAPLATNKLYTDFKVPGTPSYYLINDGKIKSGGFMDSKWQSITQTWQ